MILVSNQQRQTLASTLVCMHAAFLYDRRHTGKPITAHTGGTGLPGATPSLHTLWLRSPASGTSVCKTHLLSTCQNPKNSLRSFCKAQQHQLLFHISDRTELQGLHRRGKHTSHALQACATSLDLYQKLSPMRLCPLQVPHLQQQDAAIGRQHGRAVLQDEGRIRVREARQEVLHDQRVHARLRHRRREGLAHLVRLGV